MLAASLAADVPLFIASPTSAWASAGASFVPSPVIASRWPSACCSRMNAIFCSGVACAMKSSTPASLAMVAAVRGLSPVIITVRMPILRNSANRSTRPSLTVSLSSMTPRIRPSLSRTSGVAPRSAIRSASAVTASARPPTFASIASTAALQDRRPGGRLDAARARLGAERDLLDDGRVERRVGGVVADAGRATELGEPLAHQLDDRATLGGLVADRGDQRGVERLGLADAGRRRDRGGQSVAVGDRAGLVEEDDVDVAGRLDGAAAHREDVEARDAIHAGDPDRRQQAADRRRDQADEEGDEGDGARRSCPRTGRTAGS